MTIQPATMGYARKVGTAATAPSTLQHDFLRCTVAKQGAHFQSEGIRGVRGRQSEVIVDNIYTVGGELTLEPRPDTIATWLGYIMGGTPTGTPKVIDLAETIPTFVLDVDKGPKSCRYSGCKVNTAVFRSSPGESLQLTMDVEGLTEDSTITFPSISGTLSVLQPFMHHNIGATGLTINSVNYLPDAVELLIDNHLILNKFLSSQSRVDLPESDRTVQLTIDLPFTTDESALFGLAVGGLAGSLVYTLGGYSVTFAFAKLQAPTIGPGIDARTGEVVRRVQFTSRRATTTQELSVTVDETP